MKYAEGMRIVTGNVRRVSVAGPGDVEPALSRRFLADVGAFALGGAVTCGVFHIIPKSARPTRFFLFPSFGGNKSES